MESNWFVKALPCRRSSGEAELTQRDIEDEYFEQCSDIVSFPFANHKIFLIHCPKLRGPNRLRMFALPPGTFHSTTDKRLKGVSTMSNTVPHRMKLVGTKSTSRVAELPTVLIFYCRWNCHPHRRLSRPLVRRAHLGNFHGLLLSISARPPFPWWSTRHETAGSFVTRFNRSIR